MGVVFEETHIVSGLLYGMVKDRIGLKELKGRYVRYTLGEIGREDFWEGIADNPDSLEKKYLDKYTLNPEFYETTAYLRGKYKLAVLSNHVREWVDYLNDKYGFGKIFDKMIISSDIGLRKPDEKAYKLALNTLGVSGECCWFVDDQLKNLEKAARIGVKTIHYPREPEENAFVPDYTIKSLRDLTNIF